MRRCKVCYENKNRHTEDTVRSIAWLVKFARHPELGATHVDTWVNVGDICNDYLRVYQC